MGSVDTINRAPEDHVRKVLIALCEKDPSLDTQAMQFLHSMAEEQREASAEAKEEHNSAKRKRSTTAVEVHLCVQCNDAFTTERNDSEACTYHPGDLIEGEDFYLDHYNGDPECTVEEMYADCPDRVDWDCCEKDGTAEGCTTDWHRAYWTEEAPVADSKSD